MAIMQRDRDIMETGDKYEQRTASNYTDFKLLDFQEEDERSS